MSRARSDWRDAAGDGVGASSSSSRPIITPTRPRIRSRADAAQRRDVRASGFAYVYRSYGIHWCVNFVCEREGSASAVLIRACSRPTAARDAPAPRLHDERALCPGRENWRKRWGLPMRITDWRSTFRNRAARKNKQPDIAAGVRIGITKAVELPWRYGLQGSKFLSKPFPPRA